MIRLYHRINHLFSLGKYSRHNRGFTFVELSIIILVISILFTGSLVTWSRIDDRRKATETSKRMEEIYLSLAKFLRINGRPPCPADLTIGLYASNFGSEIGGTAPACNTSTGVDEFSSDNYYGGVPVTTLGLSEKYAFDAWGRKIGYAISKTSRAILNSTSAMPYTSLIKCWLDFSDISSLTTDSSGYLSSVTDKSGANNCNISGQSSGTYPYYVNNLISSSRNGARFNGTSHYLTMNNLASFVNLADTDSNNPYMLFIVMSPMYDASGSALFSTIDNQGGGVTEDVEMLRINFNGNSDGNEKKLQFHAKENNSHEQEYLYPNPNPELDKEINIIGFMRNSSSVGSMSFKINSTASEEGWSEVLYSTYGYSGQTASAPDHVRIGARTSSDNGGSIYAAFTLHEFLFFSGNFGLVDENSSKIINSLYSKWDPRNSPYTQMIVKRYDGQIAEAAADIVLISAGANGYGAYNSAGSQIPNSGSSLSLESYNMFSTTRADTFYTDLVNGETAKGWKTGFDDVVRYYSLEELSAKAGK